MTGTRLLTLEQDGQDRAARLRDLGGRIGGLGWLDGVVTRAVLHIGSSGRSALAVETARAVAAALRAYVPAAHLEVLDLTEPATERYGLPAITLDRDDTVVVRGPRGAAVHVPRALVRAVLPRHRRHRASGSPLAHRRRAPCAGRDPRAPQSGCAGRPAPRGGASPRRVPTSRSPAERTPPPATGGSASPSDVQVEGAVARAAGLDPARAARHPDHRATRAPRPLGRPSGRLPDLRGVATGARRAPRSSRRRSGAAAAGRRTLEDAGLVTRNLRKVPQALRRRLAAAEVGMTPLRFGVVGCGAIVTLHQLPALRRCPSLDAGRRSSTSTASWAAKVARRFGVPAAYDDHAAARRARRRGADRDAEHDARRHRLRPARARHPRAVREAARRPRAPRSSACSPPPSAVARG